MSTIRLDSFIDRGSLEQFASQIIAAVGDVACVSLHKPGGDPLWTSRPLKSSSWCRDLENLRPGKARHVELGSGRHVYCFALKAEVCEALLLCVFVNRLEAPSLAAVFDRVAPVLECLERQFALTASFSTRTAIAPNVRSHLRLMAAFNELEPDETLEKSLEAVARLWLDETRCEIVAVMLPDRKLRVVLPASAERNGELNGLFGRLITRAKATGRIVLSQMSSNARTRPTKVLCAPVLDPSGAILGIFVAIGDEMTKGHAKPARSAASRIGLFDQQFDCGRPGLLMRDEIIDVVDQSLQRLPSSPLSVLYVDVDKTHLINDSFGYDVGDRAMSKISELLKENAGRDQYVAHLMGDRFAVVLRQTDSDAALSRASHILELLGRESIERDGKTLQLSASIGIATAPFAARHGAELLTIAEVAARGAKDRGGNQSAVFQAVDASMIQRRSDADQVGYLQMALIEDRFVLHAQEIRSLDPGASSRRFEVLVRLRGDGMTLIPPQKFLSAAERYQMMPALDRWVIKRTLDMIASTTSSLELSLSSFSINVSPQSLREVDFIEHIEQAIADSGVPPDTLCFELTETAMVRNFDQAQRFVHRLQKRGCRVALDDFGTGYSSFAYLKHLPVQYLKVDGTFVRDLLESRLSEAIVAAVVDIADVMGAATVAEHVENELVWQKLIGLGVRYAQGFHVHRPEPLADILTELDRPDPHLAEFFDEAGVTPELQAVDLS